MKLFCVSLLMRKAEEGRETNIESSFQNEKERAIVQFGSFQFGTLVF